MIHHIIYIYILNIMHDNIIYPFFSQLKSSRQFTCWSLWRRSTLGCTPCPHWSWRRDLRKKSVGLGKFMEILKWNVKKNCRDTKFCIKCEMMFLIPIYLGWPETTSRLTQRPCFVWGVPTCAHRWLRSLIKRTQRDNKDWMRFPSVEIVDWKQLPVAFLLPLSLQLRALQLTWELNICIFPSSSCAARTRCTCFCQTVCGIALPGKCH